MTRKQKESQKKKKEPEKAVRKLPRGAKEAIGLFLLFFAIFSIISLTTIDAQDVTGNTAGSSRKIQNYGGPIGANLADWMYQLFGYASFLIPPFILGVAIRRFRNEKAQHRIIKVTCSILLIIEIAALLQLRWAYADPFNRGLTYKTGGVLGVFVKQLLVQGFNEIGAYLLLLTMLVITLLMLTGMSIQFIVNKVTNSWNTATAPLKNKVENWYGSIINSIQKKYDNWRRKKESPPIVRQRTDTQQRIDPDLPGETNELIGSLTRRKRVVGRRKPKETTAAEQASIFDQKEFQFVQDLDRFVLPSVGLLDDPKPVEEGEIKQELTENSQVLVEKLSNFGVSGRIMQIFPGPVITRYEFEPDPGIKVRTIMGLADDLGLAMKAKVTPMVAPVPGKSVVGIEIPNKARETIMLKEILMSEEYIDSPHKLKLALGKDTSGIPYVANLATMPHLLIAGATGAGKSVCVHGLITSLLYAATPDELKLIMIDPKMLELSVYNNIPHLREPVVTDPKKASQALAWAVNEMESRNKLLFEAGVRDIAMYNKKMKKKIDAGEELDEETPYPLPYIVIILDELADLMMVAAADVENSIARLAQMARAAGLHLIISTQRPSVNVLTGVIKANFPSRIAFQVSSKIDSRTILDSNGAERLLGKGDMLFKPVSGRLIRLHGAYVSEFEVQRVVQFVSQFKKDDSEESIFKIVAKNKKIEKQEEEYDDKYEEAVQIIVNSGNASISMLQRRLRVGHSRAARLIDMMEQEGVVGPFEGSKPREVLWKPEDMPPERDYDDLLD